VTGHHPTGQLSGPMPGLRPLARKQVNNPRTIRRSARIRWLRRSTTQACRAGRSVRATSATASMVFTHMPKVVRFQACMAMRAYAWVCVLFMIIW
jgi:hypothetical protein